MESSHHSFYHLHVLFLLSHVKMFLFYDIGFLKSDALMCKQSYIVVAIRVRVTVNVSFIDQVLYLSKLSVSTGLQKY